MEVSSDLDFGFTMLPGTGTGVEITLKCRVVDKMEHKWLNDARRPVSPSGRVGDVGRSVVRPPSRKGPPPCLPPGVVSTDLESHPCRKTSTPLSMKPKTTP